MRPYTSPAEREAAYTTLFETFNSGKTKSLAWRKWQLKQLWWMIEDNEPAIFEACKSDLNRRDLETYMGDIMGIKHDILDHIEHVEAWAADEHVKGSGFFFGTIGDAHIRKEPLGVGLVIGAWNFPFMLLLQPMIGAISAGCCVMLKPSEMAVASQHLLQDLVPRYLDQDAIRLITGGPEETTAILKYEFNHIFYTGSTNVGKIVAEAAAKHLAPTVLELGGQCPAIVTKSANIDIAAKRIMYSKVMNAGQVCLAVNHVFADPEIYDKLIERMVHWAGVFAAKGHADLPRLINEKHVNRMAYLKQWTGGTMDQGAHKCDDTICTVPRAIANVSIGDHTLSSEIFGPICPVLQHTYQESCKFINSMPNPLALYIFSTRQFEIDYILSNTNSGGVTINDSLMHAAIPGAPFGGVGASGHGSYHGKYGFDAYTHLRPVVNIPNIFERFMTWRYPPYDIKNKDRVVVKNRLGFQRGEGIDDQKVGQTRSPWRGQLLLSMVMALVIGWLLGWKTEWTWATFLMRILSIALIGSVVYLLGLVFGLELTGWVSGISSY